MSDNPKIIIILLICCLIATFLYALYQRRRFISTKEALNNSLHKTTEIENFLSMLSKSIKSVEEIENALQLTARYVADLVGVKALCIFTLEEDGYLRASAITGAFPPLHKSTDYVLAKPKYIIESLRREKIKVGEGIIGSIVTTKEPLFIPNAQSDPRIKNLDTPIKIDSLLAVPMIKNGKVMGVICGINNRREGVELSQHQFATLKFISSHVILALDIIQIYHDLSRQQRIKQELEFAKQLQNSLLPHDFPEDSHFVSYAFTKPAKEVSGDFYDFVNVDKDKTLIVIGDACGKGIPACMLMAMTRSFIRAAVDRFSTLNDLLLELNRNLYRDTADERFVTLACCLIDRKKQTVELARAGHTEIFVHIPDHKLRQIYPNGTALGLFPNELAGYFDTLLFSYKREMTILLFTDGITEALNSAGEEYGIERLTKPFLSACERSAQPNEIIDTIMRSVDAFTGNTPQVDDQTLVALKFK